MSYKECTLNRTKEIGSELTTIVMLIPSNLAKVGKFVEIKENGKLNIWQVGTVTTVEISEDQGKKLHKRWHKGWNNNI